MYEMRANDEIKRNFDSKKKAIEIADKYTELGYCTTVTDKANHMTVYVNYPLN